MVVKENRKGGLIGLIASQLLPVEIDLVRKFFGGKRKKLEK